MQDAQKGPPARPQRAKRRRRMLRYVELLSEARTPLVDFFSILLGLHRRAISRDGAPQQQLRRNGATLLRLPRFLGLYMPLTSRNIVPHREGLLA